MMSSVCVPPTLLMRRKVEPPPKVAVYIVSVVGRYTNEPNEFVSDASGVSTTRTKLSICAWATPLHAATRRNTLSIDWFIFSPGPNRGEQSHTCQSKLYKLHSQGSIPSFLQELL